jgi:hypothetical protein
MKEAEMDKIFYMHGIGYKCKDLHRFNWEETTPET